MSNRNTQPKPWTEKEFRLLLANEKFSDEAAATQVGRSSGAVGVVREGVKNWRKSGKNPGQILSQVMLRILEEATNQRMLHADETAD